MYLFGYEEDTKQANKTNQENIFSYESYIKEIENKRDDLMKANKLYEEHLRFCVVWIIEVLTLSQNSARHKELLESKLNPTKTT
jgi:hypothetical protein